MSSSGSGDRFELIRVIGASRDALMKLMVSAGDPPRLYISRNLYERLLALRLVSSGVVVFECPSNLLLPLGLVPVNWVSWRRRGSGVPKRVVVVNGIEYVCADDFFETLAITPHLDYYHALVLSSVFSRYIVFSVKDFTPLPVSVKNNAVSALFDSIRSVLKDLKERVSGVDGSGDESSKRGRGV